MTRTEALNLLREYADCKSPLWGKTPEGQKYMARFNDAVDTLAAEHDAPNIDLAEDVAKAIKKAWFLGQDYWRQADIESYKENNEAYATRERFTALIEETRNLVLRHTG